MIHETADIDPTAIIGDGAKVWRWTCIREGVVVGDNCQIGQSCYIDNNVIIGNGVKVQNSCNLFSGVSIEDDVFKSDIAHVVVLAPRSRERFYTCTPVTPVTRKSLYQLAVKVRSDIQSWVIPHPYYCC